MFNIYNPSHCPWQYRNADPNILLHQAVLNADTQTVRQLLQQPIRIDVPIHGMMPLQIAVRNGYHTIAQLLLAHGADVHFTDQSGDSLLQLAVCRNNHQMVKLLLDHGAIIQDKLLTHRSNHPKFQKILPMLLAYGAHVDALDSSGRTALYWAALRGQENIVQLLLNYGSDVNARDKNMTSTLSISTWPLQAAIQANNQGIMQLLLQRNANCHAVNDDGTTALYAAAYRGHGIMVALLFECAATTVEW